MKKEKKEEKVGEKFVADSIINQNKSFIDENNPTLDYIKKKQQEARDKK